jgi:hypothetical protein
MEPSLRRSGLPQGESCRLRNRRSIAWRAGRVRTRPLISAVRSWLPPRRARQPCPGTLSRLARVVSRRSTTTFLIPAPFRS